MRSLSRSSLVKVIRFSMPDASCSACDCDDASAA